MRSFRTAALAVLAVLALSLGTLRAEVTLYGITGDGASQASSLFTISTVDASATFFMALGNGNDGEAIAYNPFNGFMYHWSGYGSQNSEEVMERIDLSTKSVTNVPLSGFDYTEILGATFDPVDGNFLASDLDSNIVRITPGGSVTQLGAMGGVTVKGLAFSGSTLYALEQFDSFDSDSELDLLTLDPTNGDVLDSITVTLSGVDLAERSNGLAVNPETGELYGIVQGGGRRLVTIDPLTGQATQIGLLDDSFAGIAFVSSVPEPSSTALLAAMAIGGLLYRCRRRLVRRRMVEDTKPAAQ